MDFAAMFMKVCTKNGLVFSFMLIGIITLITYKLSGLTKGKVHGSAIAIFAGLVLAYIGGITTGGSKGLASIPMFAGVGMMGGGMFRDFAIVSTAFGADLREIKKVRRCWCSFLADGRIKLLCCWCCYGILHGLS